MRRSIVGAALAGGAVVAAAVAGLVDPTAVSAKDAAVPAGNLVRNPGAEANAGGEGNTRNIPPKDWLTEKQGAANGVQALRYGSHAYHPPRALAAAIGGGANFFGGGYPGRMSTATQTIDIGGAAPEIDGGGLRACLSAYLGGLRANPSWARVDLEFLAADESRLGAVSVGPITRGHRKGATTLLRRAAEKAVPQNTRQLHIVLTMSSAGDPTNYGYADNISVALARGACEPVLAVRCTRGALIATVTPSAAARTQRVRFDVRGAKGRRQVNDARAPFTMRIPTSGLSGRLTVTATVSQAGSGPIVLSKKSRRC